MGSTHSLQVAVDHDLYMRIREAASGGSPVMPKRAMKSFVIRAVRMALAGTPRKLKLCARCVKENQEMVRAPKVVEVSGTVAADSPFSHLLEDLGQAAIHGLTGAALRAGSQPSSPLLEFHTEVSPGLWVGPDVGYFEPCEGWSVLSAAKDPWHREMVGYGSPGAAKGGEFFAARRGNHMALNFINVRKLGPNGETYVAPEVVNQAMGFLEERIGAGDKVLIHCNEGNSRAPFLAYLYMRQKGLVDSVESFKAVCPEFEPGAGITQYLKEQA